MNKKIYFILFLYSCLLLGQNKTEYQKWYSNFLKIQFSDPDLSKKYLDSILSITALPDSLKSKTYNDYGIYYAVTGKYAIAIKNFNKASYTDKNSTTKTKANILCNIANTQKMAGDFTAALKNYNLAKKKYIELNDLKNQYKVESELSAVYYGKADYNKALEISSELIQKLEDFGDEKLMNIQRLRQANILFNLADFTGAINNYNKTLQYFSKNIENNLQNKNIALMNIGECYSELGSSVAQHYFNQALIGFKKIKDLRNENLCLSRIGKFYYKKKQYSLSLPYLKESFEFMYNNLPHLSTEIFIFYLKNLISLNKDNEIVHVLQYDQNKILENANLQEEIFYYKTLASIRNKQKNILEEYKILKKLEKLYEERESKNSFEEIQKKLNQYNIKNEIHKNKNLKLELANANLLKWFISSIFLFLVIIAYYIFDKYKKINKLQKLRLIQLENEKQWHKKNIELVEEKLRIETELVKIKERELTALELKKYQIRSKIIDLIKFNEIDIESKLLNKLIKKIDSLFSSEDYWNEFQLKFTNMHPNFIIKVKKDFPNLTKKDLDFLILIKLNLSNKEIASLISISYESVLSKKYLLRKKLGFISDNALFDYLSAI